MRPDARERGVDAAVTGDRTKSDGVGGADARASGDAAVRDGRNAFRWALRLLRVAGRAGGTPRGSVDRPAGDGLGGDVACAGERIVGLRANWLGSIAALVGVGMSVADGGPVTRAEQTPSRGMRSEPRVGADAGRSVACPSARGGASTGEGRREACVAVPAAATVWIDRARRGGRGGGAA